MAAFSCSTSSLYQRCMLNPIALKKAKIVYNFGLSECNRVKMPSFMPFLQKGGNFCGFLFTSLRDKALLKRGILFTSICLYGNFSGESLFPLAREANKKMKELLPQKLTKRP